MDKLCSAIGFAHEFGPTIVHTVTKMEVEKDDEFEIINFLWDDEVDPYLTTLVNAVGLRKRTPQVLDL